MGQIEKSLEKKNFGARAYLLTSDGYTNKAQVNLVNFEAFTSLGPVHWHTTQRTAAEIWKDSAYVSGVVRGKVRELNETEKVAELVSDNKK